jgi:hypothetical protein
MRDGTATLSFSRLSTSPRAANSSN